MLLFLATILRCVSKISGDDSAKRYAVSAKNLTSQRNDLIQQKNTLCQQKLTESAKRPGEDSAYMMCQQHCVVISIDDEL